MPAASGRRPGGQVAEHDVVQARRVGDRILRAHERGVDPTTVGEAADDVEAPGVRERHQPMVSARPRRLGVELDAGGRQHEQPVADLVRSPTMCDERSTVVPWATASATVPRNSRRASGSRLARGSSRSNTGACVPRASVRASWACWPPDRWPAGRSSGIPASASRRSAPSASNPGRSSAASAIWSRGVSTGVDARRLAHIAELAKRSGCVASHVDPQHVGAASGRALEAQERADEGGLAGAVGPDQSDEGAPRALRGVTFSSAGVRPRRYRFVRRAGLERCFHVRPCPSVRGTTMADGAVSGPVVSSRREARGITRRKPSPRCYRQGAMSAAARISRLSRVHSSAGRAGPILAVAYLGAGVGGYLLVGPAPQGGSLPVLWAAIAIAAVTRPCCPGRTHSRRPSPRGRARRRPGRSRCTPSSARCSSLDSAVARRWRARCCWPRRFRWCSRSRGSARRQPRNLARAARCAPWAWRALASCSPWPRRSLRLAGCRASARRLPLRSLRDGSRACWSSRSCSGPRPSHSPCCSDAGGPPETRPASEVIGDAALLVAAFGPLVTASVLFIPWIYALSLIGFAALIVFAASGWRCARWPRSRPAPLPSGTSPWRRARLSAHASRPTCTTGPSRTCSSWPGASRRATMPRARASPGMSPTNFARCPATSGCRSSMIWAQARHSSGWPRACGA